MNNRFVSSTREQLRRIEAKFRHLAATKQGAEMEELTGLKRRYAHLHTPKHLINPDHLGPKLSSFGAPLPIAARYTGGRIPLTADH